MQRPTPAVYARFFKHIRYDHKTGCWLWKGCKDKKGYGCFKFENRKYWAHRFAKQALDGPFQYGEEADHLCHNSSCVNPDHIKAADKVSNSICNSRTQKGKARKVKPLPKKPMDDIPF